MVRRQRHQMRPPFPSPWQKIDDVDGEAASCWSALSGDWQWLSLDRRLGALTGTARSHAFACAGDLGPPHLAQTLQIVKWIVVGPFVIIFVVNCFTSDSESDMAAASKCVFGAGDGCVDAAAAVDVPL
ncbi:uncharacterized protein LOC117195189 [Drosophila miranda]|uniref:uncharacterized protein LOC117194582 n=1 Tax=Drosophila miranda TaxID=7229 RepID=UPI00143F269F|nr:uncharacterized protein LOC117194582 [Drosophila miranda]XP_033255721.1 uncharacterized protein LOC117195189 [Drosophila miranda]